MIGSGGKISLTDHFKNIFWPIKNEELGKFLPMSALMFFILFNQNVLRILKDSILISEVSAEVTGFAKLYCVTPMATIFVIVYAKMLNNLSFDRIFYYLIYFFGAFFLIFAFVIYPNVDFFHLDTARTQRLMAEYPHLKWYIAIMGNWSYVMFYSFSELWPNIFYVLLFWQFANETTTTSEAKRFYTLFALLGNSSLIFVGFMMMNLSSASSFFGSMLGLSGSKIVLVRVSIAAVTVSSVLCCLIVRYITQHVLKDPALYSYAKRERSTKEKPGIIESFKYIAKSRYLWLMLICSASFGLSMNLVEAVWKSKIKELYPDVNSYAEFNSIYILWTGVVIMVMTIIGNNMMRRGSWFTVAIITPVIIMVTGTAFFFLVVFDSRITTVSESAILLSPLALAVLIGAVQNVLSKGTKYSVWDSALQMLYIPLNVELRTKGKAAVDVISPKIGKSASGLVLSVIFTIIPNATYSSISPVLMVVFIAVCICWVYAVRKIYLEYKKIA